jgi:hypothetical protein
LFVFQDHTNRRYFFCLASLLQMYKKWFQFYILCLSIRFFSLDFCSIFHMKMSVGKMWSFGRGREGKFLWGIDARERGWEHGSLIQARHNVLVKIVSLIKNFLCFLAECKIRLRHLAKVLNIYYYFAFRQLLKQVQKLLIIYVIK